MLNFKENYNAAKKERDARTDANSLWQRLEGTKLNDAQVSFLTNCMTENLNHARHAENERLTFNSIFLALVAGALAFADAFTAQISFFIYLALTLAGFLSMLLTARWNNTFSRHIYYAQCCYKMVHKELFGDRPDKGEDEDEDKDNDNDIDKSQWVKSEKPEKAEDEKAEDVEKHWESIENLNDVPMYCFKIHSPIAYTSLGKAMYKVRTRVLYNSFYWLIQILLISCTALKLWEMLA